MKRIVILTGAGISKESGLDTFRDAGGIWSKVRLEDVATPEGFRANPQLVHDFYNARRRQLQDPAIKPNPAHEALAHLERQNAGRVLIVTQNIDDLHERAGSTNLIHMHGEMLKIRCDMCGSVLTWQGDIELFTPCPACAREGGLRPHVVWFGELPLMMDRIYEELAQCELFVSIGTSGNVYPAAGFVAEVKRWGRAHTVELNLEPSEGSSHFQERIHGPASQIVPDFVARLLSSF
ncbi:MAG: NAD-dependent protein deacylase [Alphaproteobacteria bacterium]|nr:NAD-dependent protein deacylase [Alphaproteobacteria bacterium]